MNWWRYQRKEGVYREQIQSLAPEKPLELPAIKPLKARKMWKLRAVSDRKVAR